MAGGMQPNVGLGAGVAPTNKLVGTPIPGTAVSGVQTVSGPLMALQNSPLGEQAADSTGVLAGVHKSGYHPSWESGYGVSRMNVAEDDSFRGGFLEAEGRMKKSSEYKPAETYTAEQVKELKEEYAKQQEILAAQRQQFAELAAGSGTPQPTGAGSVNVGSRGPIQINPLNPVAQIKQPDILTGPFLGRWRR